MLAGDTLWRPFWASPGERVAELGLGLAGGLLLGQIRYRAYVLMLTGVLLALIGGSVWAFRRHGILLDWVFPSCGLVVLGLAASTARIGIEVAARQRQEAELAIDGLPGRAENEIGCGPRRKRCARASLSPWTPLGWAFGTQTCAPVPGTTPPGTTQFWVSPRHHRDGVPDILLSRVVPEDRAAAARGLAEATRPARCKWSAGSAVRTEPGLRPYSWPDLARYRGRAEPPGGCGG